MNPKNAARFPETVAVELAKERVEEAKQAKLAA